MNNINEPQLQAPGAGLPFFERVFLKYYVGPFIAVKSPFSWTEENFEPLHKKILDLALTISPAKFEEKTLVPRLRGIEDSSRYWSAKMTLEHILIVGKSVRDIVLMLSQEKDLGVIVDIASVKPTNSCSREEILEQFENYTKETIPFLKQNIQNYESQTKLFHPWFGPMPLKMWTWLLVVHGSIHHKQLKEIKKNLL